jgi:membrane-associated phospholipid phosphatase
MTKTSTALLVAGLVLAGPGRGMAQLVSPDAFTQTTVAVQPAPATASSSFTNPSLGATFKSVGGDLRQMFSRDNASVLTMFGTAAIFATRWDRQAVGEMRELPAGVLSAGNPTGALMTQLGAALGTFAVGKMTHSARILTLGSHLIRAQVSSQIVVQTLKFSAERSRPDATNHLSFPSGHTASAFATATVLQRDFGWKLGIPAYAVGAYVAASRMRSNKHYLSDVLVGAAIGVSAGRAVTIGSNGMKFDVGVAPTTGGAALMFTRKN